MTKLCWSTFLPPVGHQRFPSQLMLDAFNPLNISCLASQLKPKQLIGKAMQGDKTLQTLLVCMTGTLWRFYLCLVYLTIMWLFFVLKPTYPPPLLLALVLAGSLLQDATHTTVKSRNLVDTSTLLTGRYWSQLTARAKLDCLRSLLIIIKVCR